jgi:hypothetical protein
MMNFACFFNYPVPPNYDILMRMAEPEQQAWR